MPAKGAYGLVFDNLAERDPDLFVDAESHWQPWRVTHVTEPAAALADHRYNDFVDESSARLTLDPSGYVLLDRAGGESVLHLDHEPSLDELVHPGLATTGATVAWWQGRLALHGGAVTGGGSAVAFLAEREHGKSSTLAWLISRGWGSISDDLLVIDGTEVLAGPRIVDLRQQTAERWGVGSYVGVVGTRERWRFRTPAVAARARLAALVALRWGSEVELTRVPPGQRITELLRYRALNLEPRPSALLQLLSVPMYVLTRPRDLSGLESSISALLAEIGV